MAVEEEQVKHDTLPSSPPLALDRYDTYSLLVPTALHLQIEPCIENEMKTVTGFDGKGRVGERVGSEEEKESKMFNMLMRERSDRQKEREDIPVA